MQPSVLNAISALAQKGSVCDSLLCCELTEQSQVQLTLGRLLRCAERAGNGPFKHDDPMIHGGLLLSEAFATATVNVRAATQSQGTNLCTPWKVYMQLGSREG